MSDPAPVSDYCLFRRDQVEYAISTRFVREILEARPFTPVPFAPPDLLGAFNLRGEVVALVHLDGLLERPLLPLARSGRLVVLGIEDFVVAVVVDAVRDVRHWSPWQIKRPERPMPEVVRGEVTQDGETITVFDGDRVLGTLIGRITNGLGHRPAGLAARATSRSIDTQSTKGGRAAIADAPLEGGNAS